MLFGSTLLEVAIGVIFVYLLVSLLCSALNEFFEALLKNRANDLEKGIRKLLNNPSLADALLQHPLIKPLGERPSYIPARTFSLALWNLATTWEGRARAADAAVASLKEAAAKTKDAAKKEEMTGKLNEVASKAKKMRNNAEAAPAGATQNLEAIRKFVAGLDEEHYKNIKLSLLSLMDEAGSDINKARANIEGWYNDAMDRVSGWYKRRTHIILIFIGLLAAGFLNIDTITITRALLYNDTLRSSVAVAAQEYAKSNPAPTPSTGEPNSDAAREKIKNITEDINKLNLPIGWIYMPREDDAKYKAIADAAKRKSVFDADMSAYQNDPRRFPSGDPYAVFLKLLGIILTAMAVSQGAPFWFDMLNKFIVIRSTVKPREKSREEGTKDKSQTPPTPPPGDDGDEEGKG